MNQRQRILRHLQTFGSITALEAMQEYGIMRLAARIADLEKEGYRLKHERRGSAQSIDLARRYTSRSTPLLRPFLRARR